MIDCTCWCGNAQLTEFGRGFWLCSGCQTLVGEERATGSAQERHLADLDYYSQRYWFDHQAELGNPNIETRAIQDLPERCAAWLATLLRYRLPPARILEISCAHGGFLPLSRWLGFSVQGLEVSPWTADFALRTFAVPVLTGYLEEQEFEPDSFQVIFMMDVLEHLATPLSTLEACRRFLKNDGILVLQTPCFPAPETLASLESTDSPFLRMLIPREHLHLFSRDSVEELCRRSGFDHFAYEPALFPYDMFIIASSEPLDSTISPEQVASSLSTKPLGRLVLALLQGTGRFPVCRI